MASPQVEDGYTKIANELLDALCRIRLSGRQSQIVHAVLRCTYGFNKKETKIKLAKLEEMTGLKKRNISTEIKRLEGGKVLNVVRTDKGYMQAIGINKDYDDWVNVLKTENKKFSKLRTNVLKTENKKFSKLRTNIVTTKNKKFSKLRTNVLKTENKKFSKPRTSINIKETLKDNSKDVGTKKRASDCPHKKIMDLYHEILPELPRVKIWSKERRANLRARWNMGYKSNSGLKSCSIDFWSQLFQYIRKSDFLMGQVSRNDKPPFIADLGWIVKKANFIKIVEGKYHQ